MADSWNDRPGPIPIIMYSVGGLLCARACLHVLVCLATDSTLNGPVSWRQPNLFVFSAEVIIISTGWLVGRPTGRLGDFSCSRLLAQRCWQRLI
jgi:hypothetical protein